MEKDLYLWFVRFCMRPGSRSPRESRPFLLVACCQFAREYQKYVVGAGVRESDENLKRGSSASRPMWPGILQKPRPSFFRQRPDA